MRRIDRTLTVVVGVGLAALGGCKAYEGAPPEVVSEPQPQPREIHVTKDPRYAWGEHQIAINPTNPDNIAYITVGVTLCEGAEKDTPDCEQLPAVFDPPVPGLPAMARGERAKGFYTNPDFVAIYAYYSFDGGRTWERSRLPAHPVGLPRLNSQGDPSITVTPDGTFYASWDANDWGTPEKTLPAAGVAVSRSSDGGRTWTPAHLSGVPVDGPKIVSDLTEHSVYVASSTFRGARATGNPADGLDPTNSRWLVRTSDGARFTQARPMGGLGATMSAAHGILATAFVTTAMQTPFTEVNNALCGSAPAPCAIFQTTTDAGATWTRHVMPVRLPASAMAAPGAMPVVAADPTRRGRFSAAVPMNRSGEFHVYTTEDAGRTWSLPTVVTQDAGRMHYHAAMSYSRDGVLGLAWHTRSDPPPTGMAAMRPPPSPFTVWAAISRDQGRTFSAPLMVSTGESPGGNGSGDDYSDVKLSRDTLYAGWADWRPGTRSGFMAAVPLSAFRMP